MSYDNKIKHIAILRLTALGDCINAYGLVGGLLQASNEPLHIHFIVDQKFASVFTQSCNNKNISIHAINLKQDKLKNLLTFKRELTTSLHGHKLYALLNLQTSIKASLCSLFIKTPLKIGYDKERSREGQRFFVNKVINKSSDPHVVSGFLEFAKSLGFEQIKPFWDFKLEEQALNMAKNLSNKKLFLISPSSAKVEKNWTSLGYSQCAKYAHDLGFEVVLIGDKSTICQELCNDITKLVNFKLINLAGKTTFAELLAVIKQGSLMLSPDSGPMHIASALNTPVIGLFAIHNDKRVGPYNYMHLNVSVYNQQAKLELGCDKIPWRYRVKNKQAMNYISFDMVKNSIDKALTMYKII